MRMISSNEVSAWIYSPTGAASPGMVNGDQCARAQGNLHHPLAGKPPHPLRDRLASDHKLALAR